jgi:hypothetical protein
VSKVGTPLGLAIAEQIVEDAWRSHLDRIDGRHLMKIPTRAEIRMHASLSKRILVVADWENLWAACCADSGYWSGL